MAYLGLCIKVSHRSKQGVTQGYRYFEALLGKHQLLRSLVYCRQESILYRLGG